MKPYDYVFTDDKSVYGPGPWASEPDEWEGQINGYDCCVLRQQWGSFCGYIRVPEDHPAFGLDYSTSTIELEEWENWTEKKVKAQRMVNEISVHGGLTYGGRDSEGWFGFDCSHYKDVQPGSIDRWRNEGIYRNFGYVMTELVNLANQFNQIKESCK